MRRQAVTFELFLAVALAAAACAGATETVDRPEPTNTEPPEAEVETVPAVTVSDQDAGQGVVIIDSVTAAEPGWIVIHINQEGAPGPVIGQAPVEAGENLEVRVEIDLRQATQELFAMLHLDAGEHGEYEFPGEDVPVQVEDGIVNVLFTVALPFTPSVRVDDQSAVDGAVTIGRVVAAQPGWLVVHAEADGAPGPVIGQAPVEVGENPDVRVDIDLERATSTLYAMLHLDTGAAGEYEFPDGDAPVFDEDGYVVVTSFTLQEAGAGAAGEHELRVVDSAFRDKEISVPVGTTITWVYDATLPHTVTSDDDLFNSGTLSEGETFSFTFTEPGTYAYYCRFHGGPGGQGMSGVITVTEG